jgi:hypothetical protein
MTVQTISMFAPRLLLRAIDIPPSSPLADEI